jgi:sulfatase-like protein
VPTPSRPRWFLVATGAIVVGVCVAVLPRMLLLADWGATLQKLLVLAAWAGGLLFAAALPAGRSRRLVLAAAAPMVLVAIGGSAVVAARDEAPQLRDRRAAIDLSLAIERYATFDTSFAVLLDVFRPMVSDDEFYDVLRRVGDATDDRSLSPVPLRIGVEPHARPSYRPHIFIFTIDSLRPDYLSAYNPSVTFTPAVGAFAKESVVMRQAFTPYAGTALSQPALWAGGLIQRAMYVKPFSEVNNLERLVRTSGYQAYISVDEILSVILGDWPDMVRLDAHLTHPERKDQMFKFDLCSTVKELTERLDGETMETPVFFYSQPQSLHIRVLAGDEQPVQAFRRTGSTSVFKPAAAALSRVDACFGGLIDYLKRRHVYDDSVIVLTSDHGDSYGEAGRWGHAFYVAPEILRIPLIIHLPARLKDEGRWNVDAVAMLTDLTPTLYDLLGLKAAPLQEPAGRTLMNPMIGEPPPLRDMHLIQSSYSRVFGLIDGAGKWMYTADANHKREEFYDLGGGRESEGKTLVKADRLRYRKWLLERLRALDRYYGRPLDPDGH